MSQFIEMFGNSPQKELGELATFVNGSAFKPEEWSQEGLPIVRIQNLTQGDAPYNYYSGDTSKKVCLNTGDILVSWSATLGVFTWSKGPALLNQHIFKVVFDKLDIEQSFFIYTVKLALEKMADKAHGSTMRHVVKKDFDSTKVSFPSMREQQRFVSIAEQADKSKFYDFKSQFIEMFGNPLSLNQKNELKRLGECCILNPRRPNIALCDTDKVSFIPMPAVSEDGYLVDMTGEEYGKVKKGFTYFENNDVLFAKITPCMENGKGAIVHGLTNGIGMGSTEFHVLRPINGISSPYWLLALTRMPIFRERAAKNMSGTGGQKRVSASYLDHFMVGLPAIEEQRRFEAIYKQADKSKSVIQKALVYLNDIQSGELGKIA
jgi:type I restriction enzyme S subunit